MPSLSEEKFEVIQDIDFHNIVLTSDGDCYIKPMCQTCYGANFEMNGSPSIKDKSKCLWMKLRVLYSSRLLVNRKEYYIKNTLIGR